MEADDLVTSRYYTIIYDGTSFVVINPSKPVINTANIDTTSDQSFVSLIQLSNATDTDSDITFSAGTVINSTNNGYISLGTAITKQLDNIWVEGLSLIHI